MEQELCNAVDTYNTAKDHLKTCEDEHERQVINTGLKQLQPIIDFLSDIKQEASSHS